MDAKEGVRAERVVDGEEVKDCEVASDMAKVTLAMDNILVQLEISLTREMPMICIMGARRQVSACQNSGKH